MIIRALSAIDDLLFTRLGFSHRVMWLASVGFGMCAGLGIYTFLYANGLSYVSNDPVVCANCHVMQPYYSGWVKNSHHTVAVCNDCHTPHDFIGKYITKASNGFHHSMAFHFLEILNKRQIWCLSHHPKYYQDKIHYRMNPPLFHSI